ncbi:unnamed protein product [Amoebophrya sp. A120]|nr:unnamed protein product [Amoebophrya sp. A120]|eukprot:GSA120T00012172001.1
MVLNTNHQKFWSSASSKPCAQLKILQRTTLEFLEDETTYDLEGKYLSNIQIFSFPYAKDSFIWYSYEFCSQ